MPFVFPPQLPSISFQPRRYRPNGLGFWSGHIPFACDLVATQRPRLLVELGTQMGESYFAFCQAIVENGVDCKAFAVDTWRGDQHTRPYDDVVYNEVSAHNQAHYAHFSTLLRLRFDEAVSHFDEQSIDLLHIDGAHTYEAVCHDFLTWWPKVREGGVVVMHDSAERQWEFGVWKLVEELRSTGLHTGEFLHSHGLAVVVKPPVQGDEHVATAFVTATEERREQMRAYYETCAGNLLGKFLQKRQANPGEWDVITHLFWRTADQAFSDEHSVQLAHITGPNPEEKVLYIPPSEIPYAGFRLVLTLVPAILHLYSITVKDRQGGVLWSSEEPGGLLFAGGSEETTFDLQLPRGIQEGGEMRLVLSGLSPFAAVARQQTA